MTMRPRTIAIASLAVALLGGTARAQAPNGLAFGVSGYAVYWVEDGSPFDAFGGPALQISWLNPRGLGFDFRGGYIVSTGPEHPVSSAYRTAYPPGLT
jgi:hypothetical protein